MYYSLYTITIHPSSLHSEGAEGRGEEGGGATAQQQPVEDTVPWWLQPGRQTDQNTVWNTCECSVYVTLRKRQYTMYLKSAVVCCYHQNKFEVQLLFPWNSAPVDKHNTKNLALIKL